MDSLKITFLGTSAGMPSRERNVACVAMTIDGATLLFDCGEATQHQLLRSGVRMGSIDAVFLTHLHGDHLYGLPGLLSSMSLNARERPLAVIGPPPLRDYLAALPHFHTTFEVVISEPGEHRGDGWRVAAAALEHSVPCFAYALIEDDRPGAFDVARATALGVQPGPLFGRLQHGETVGEVRPSDVMGPPRRGRRVVYCTDTRPCASAATLASGADILIHESTYADDMAAEAHARFHSTASEAAVVARDAGVARLILTHISPRYLDPSPLLAEARAVFASTELAADLASFDVPRAE
jgi:ribonuclease Z